MPIKAMAMKTVEPGVSVEIVKPAEAVEAVQNVVTGVTVECVNYGIEILVKTQVPIKSKS